MFVDFALAYALLNFTGSLAAARFLHRTKDHNDDHFDGGETSTREEA